MATDSGRLVSGARTPGLLERLLADVAAVAFARFGRDGTLIDANSRFRAISGSADGAVRLTHLVVAGQSEEMARLLAGSSLPGDRRNVHFASGEQLPVTLLVTWARDGDDLVLVGEPPVADEQASQVMLVRLTARVAALARENAKRRSQLQATLDDLRQAQAMLVHREKMAALGQMTAGVAHELNNPLAYVRNNLFLLGQGVESVLGLVDLVGEHLDEIEALQPALFEALMGRIEEIDLPRLGDRIPELLDSVDQGLERAMGLVISLRRFSRLDEAEIKIIDVNESLRSVVEFVGLLVTETDTELTVDYGELPPVACQPGALNQAVLNILTNAIQASSPGGQVVLTTRLAGDVVRISVSDDGPGVPDDIADRVFDPFFKTRPVGEGTGLGLSIAHTLVAAHGGKITLARPATGGAVFTIDLPREKGVAL